MAHRLEVVATSEVLQWSRSCLAALRRVHQDRRSAALGYATTQSVRDCYRYLLDREPDDEGYRGYVTDISARPTPVRELVDTFLASEEFHDRLHGLFTRGGLAPERVELGDGSHLYVAPDDDQVGAQVRRAGAYEQKLRDRITEVCTPGAVFVDVGASIGIFSVLAGRLVGPSGHVVAIEPGPQNYSLLLLNISSNDLHNVETIPCAVSDVAGTVLYGRSGGNGFIRPFDGDATHLQYYDLVATKTLDDLLAGQERIDVVKMDVEGAEALVFRGARRLLEVASATLFFELTPNALRARSGIEPVEMLATIMDYGYSFDVLVEDGEDLIDLPVYGLLDIFEESGLGHLNIVARPRRA